MQHFLEDVADNLFVAFERNLFSSGLFLGVSKAFDAISHNVLCDKLYKLGVRAPFWELV